MDPKTIAAGLIAAALFAFSAAHANESQEKTFKETAAKDTVTAALIPQLTLQILTATGFSSRFFIENFGNLTDLFHKLHK